MENITDQLEIKEQTKLVPLKADTEKDITPLMEAKRKIAEETGRFYNSLIDTYLEATTLKERRKKINLLLEGLSTPLKKLYGEGLKKLEEELSADYSLLEQHRGDEILYLLGSVMASERRSPEEMEQIFQHIDKAKYIEPSPGVAIIQVEQDFFSLLKDHGIVLEEAHAIAFRSNNPSDPSFLMIQRLSLDKNVLEDSEQAKKNQYVRHELHHVLWNFLERRGDYLRNVAESSPERTAAFRFFRDEVAAYIISGRDIGSIDPDCLVYTQDKELLKIASDARDFVAICIDFGKKNNIHPQSFLYASMSSRNFTELKNNFTTLTPLEKIDIQSVQELYDIYSHRYGKASKIVELIERKGLAVSGKVIEEAGLNYILSNQNIRSMGEVFSKIKNLKRFANEVTSDIIDEDGLLNKIAQVKLPLPKETIDVILKFSPEHLNTIPLGISGKEFLKSVVSYWNIQNESAYAMYKQILESSPVMREAFSQIRDEIITNGAESYRNEFQSSDDEKKQQVEAEIAKRTRLLMEL